MLPVPGRLTLGDGKQEPPFEASVGRVGVSHCIAWLEVCRGLNLRMLIAGGTNWFTKSMILCGRGHNRKWYVTRADWLEGIAESMICKM